MKNKTEIQQLIKSCQQRDLTAQRALYDAYIDRIYYIVRRYISDQYYISNVIQDIFLKVYNNIDRFDENKGAFSTWINTISVRESISHLRKAKLKFVVLDKLEDTISVENSIISRLNADDIIKVLSTIQDKYRIVFNLYEIDGYSHKEIGEILNISESSSRTYLSRAKKMLQEALKKNLAINKNYKYGR